MREDFDRELCKTLAKITGLINSPEALNCVVGTVYATVFLGVFPHRDDLSNYLELPKGVLNRFLGCGVKTAVKIGSNYSQWMEKEMLPKPTTTEYIYPLATKAVASGLYFGDGDEWQQEPASRMVARTFLDGLWPPQIIKTESAFVGYNLLLEYLWKAMEEPEEIEDIHSFCKKRYRYRKNIYEKIDEVCLLISHENRPMFNDEQNYKEICQEMARALNEDVAVA